MLEHREGTTPDHTSETEPRQSRKLSFGEQVVLASTFVRSWERLTRQQRSQMDPHIRGLVAKPRHPSCQVPRHHQSDGDIWICYVSRGYRLLYTQTGTQLSLLEVGPHRIVDRVHRRHFRL